MEQQLVQRHHQMHGGKAGIGGAGVAMEQGVVGLQAVEEGSGEVEGGVELHGRSLSSG